MNKFKITKLLPIISICSLCSVSLVSSLISSSKKSEEFSFHNISEPGNNYFDLATDNLKNGAVMNIGGKSTPGIIKAQKKIVNSADYSNPNIYNKHSVISSASSNTVNSAQYIFNFVPDSSNSHLKIIGTPIDSNVDDLISYDTDLKISETSEKISGLDTGSALWIKNHLIICSLDINGNSALYDFRIEKSSPGVSGTKNILVEKQKIIIQNNFGTNVNYSISPISRAIDESNSFLLFPQGIDISDLKNNPGSIKEIVFSNNHMKINAVNLNLNVNLTNNDQIISMNSIKTDKDQTFFLITRGSDESGDLTGYQLFKDGRTPIIKKIAGLNDGGTNSTEYKRPTFDLVKQYAMVNSDIEAGQYYLYWISQNSKNVTNPAPDSINKIILKTNNEGFFESNGYQSENIPLSTKSGGFQALLKIQQISYDNSADSHIMNLRFSNWKSGNDTYNAPIFLDDDHQFDYQSLYNQFNTNSWKSSGFISGSQSNTPESMTIFNGNMFFTYIKIDLGNDNSYINLRPTQLYIDESGEKIFINPTTLDTQATKTIILSKNNKISDYDFSFWNTQVNPKEPVQNSALRIAVNNINNILDYQQQFNRPSEQDDIINISSVDTSDNDNYKIFRTFAKYGLSNGIFNKGNSFTNDFILWNNPLAFDANFNFFDINKNFIKGKASEAESQLNLFNSLKTKDLVIGKENRKTIQEKIVQSNQSIIGSDKDKSLIFIDKTYMDYSFNSLNCSSDDNNGNLKGSIYFLNKSTKDLVVIDFDISGFNSLVVVLVPSIVVPIVLIALAVLITMIVLRKKNKKDVVEVSRSGYKLAKKLNTNTNDEYKKSITKHIELSNINPSNPATSSTVTANKVSPPGIGKPPITANKVPTPGIGKPPITANKVPAPGIGKPPVTANKVPQPGIGKPPITANKVPTPGIGKPPIK